MTVKELLKSFKAPSWSNGSELETLAASAPPLDLKIVSQMLDMLTNKRLVGDLQAHIKRCALFTKVTTEIADKEMFAPLVRALGQGDSRVRNAVAPLLPQVNSHQEHATLCNLLRSPDVKLRRSVAEVIKEVGGKTVLEVLGALVEQPGFPGRVEAMDAALPVAGHYATDLLQSVVKWGSPPEKLRALKYLGDRHYMAKAMPRALKAILTALEDKAPSAQVVVQTVTSFSGLATEEAYFNYIGHFLDSDDPNIVRAAIWGLRHFGSPQVLGALDRKLRSGQQLLQMEALSSLENIGTPEVLPPVVAALSSKNVAIRNRAGEVLSRLSKEGKVEVSRVIIWLLRSRDVNVRRMAVEIARTIEDPNRELWPKLVGMLRDEDWWVRERVTDVLVEMAGRELIPHIAALLSDQYDVVRRFAVEVLGRLGDPQVLGALITRAREDSDWWVKEKAVEAMVALKDERAIPYIVELMRADADIRLSCLQALLEIGARDVVPHVAEMLGSDDGDIRLAALSALRELEANEMAPRIQPLLADPDPRVARTAREMLIHWNIEMSSEFVSAGSKAQSFLDRMLVAACEAKADDLILASGRKPYIKQLGKTAPLSNATFSAEQIRQLLTPQLTLSQMEQLDACREVDFSYDVRAAALRFRVNVFHQHGGLGAVFRVIKGELSRMEELGLPPVVQRFGDYRHGLVLFGGPTGSGKSTSLAAIIDYINRNTDRHVISLEDPIEVVHESKKGLVNQREIGTHTRSFTHALRSTLRQDPDVILVGEMRDLETIQFAVTAAETGHLIFGTVHTVSAHTSVDRLINTYPAAEQDQVRATLAENLRAVVCQYLLRRKDDQGRVLAAEVMLNSDAIAAMIRKGKTFQIPSVIATSVDQGMQLMDGQLMRLYREGAISAEEAYMKADVKKEFEEIFAEAGKDDGAKVEARSPTGDGDRQQAAGAALTGPSSTNPGQARVTRA